MSALLVVTHTSGACFHPLTLTNLSAYHMHLWWRIVNVHAPKPLIHKSFLWSSQRTRTWLDLVLNENKYKKSKNLTPICKRRREKQNKHSDWSHTKGSCNSNDWRQMEMSLFFCNECPYRFDDDDQIDRSHPSHIVTNWSICSKFFFTYRKPRTGWLSNWLVCPISTYEPYTILPIVSSRAPPTGHLFMSSFWAFLCNQNNKILLPKSNTESMPVANSERDDPVIAAHTRNEVGQNVFVFSEICSPHAEWQLMQNFQLDLHTQQFWPRFS